MRIRRGLDEEDDERKLEEREKKRVNLDAQQKGGEGWAAKEEAENNTYVKEATKEDFNRRAARLYCLNRTFKSYSRPAILYE